MKGNNHQNHSLLHNVINIPPPFPYQTETPYHIDSPQLNPAVTKKLINPQ